jgi:hypothetical protein
LQLTGQDINKEDCTCEEFFLDTSILLLSCDSTGTKCISNDPTFCSPADSAISYFAVSNPRNVWRIFSAPSLL